MLAKALLSTYWIVSGWFEAKFCPINQWLLKHALAQYILYKVGLKPSVVPFTNAC